MLRCSFRVWYSHACDLEHRHTNEAIYPATHCDCCQYGHTRTTHLHDPIQNTCEDLHPTLSTFLVTLSQHRIRIQGISSTAINIIIIIIITIIPCQAHPSTLTDRRRFHIIPLQFLTRRPSSPRLQQHPPSTCRRVGPVQQLPRCSDSGRQSSSAQAH